MSEPLVHRATPDDVLALAAGRASEAIRARVLAACARDPAAAAELAEWRAIGGAVVDAAAERAAPLPDPAALLAAARARPRAPVGRTAPPGIVLAAAVVAILALATAIVVVRSGDRRAPVPAPSPTGAAALAAPATGAAAANAPERLRGDRASPRPATATAAGAGAGATRSEPATPSAPPAPGGPAPNGALAPGGPTPRPTATEARPLGTAMEPPAEPTPRPTSGPTRAATARPTATPAPTLAPSAEPSAAPTLAPTASPTPAEGAIAFAIDPPEGTVRAVAWPLAGGDVRSLEVTHGSVHALPPGEWLFFARPPGSEPAWLGDGAVRPAPLELAPVPITAGVVAEATWRFRALPADRGVLHGRVEQGDGSPAERAVVHARGAEGRVLSVAVLPGAEGRFEVAVPVGAWSLAATAGPHGTPSWGAAVELGPGETSEPIVLGLP